MSRLAVCRMVLAIGLTMVTTPAQAAFLRTFDLTYSGAALGNKATGIATITLDLSLLRNPGETQTSGVPFVTAFSITISGATAGNGTFGLGDYDPSSLRGLIFLNTNGGTLDFGKQLIGQPTAGAPFGTVPSSGEAGDFNIVSNFNEFAAPTARFYFRIATNGGNGDELYLTSFAPAAVPEPGGLVLTSLGLGTLAGCAGWGRIRREIARRPAVRSPFAMSTSIVHPMSTSPE
jgi:hypothetical protein